MLRSLAFAVLLLSLPACAQDSAFSAGANGAVVHASGLVCPAAIGTFTRDANGLRNLERSADYCAYSAPSGIYGTVIVMPLPSPFDPEAVLASEFRIQEATDGQLIGEESQTVGGVPVYLRSYQTARIELRQYRTVYACAALGAWVVTVILEYGYPQDKPVATAFLESVYGEVAKTLAPRGNP